MSKPQREHDSIRSSLPVFVPLPDQDYGGYSGVAVETSAGLVRYLDTERVVHKGPVAHPELATLVELLHARTVNKASSVSLPVLRQQTMTWILFGEVFV
jgi:hypothetical protein